MIAALSRRRVPAVPRRIRFIAAACVWTVVGVVLLCRGGFLLAAAQTPYLVAALLLSLLKTVFLVRMADRNVERLSRQPDRICMGGMYSWRVWMLVSGMVVFGGIVRRFLPPAVVGVVFFAVGVALLGGGMRIWRHVASARG